MGVEMHAQDTPPALSQQSKSSRANDAEAEFATWHVEVGEHAGVRPTWVSLGAAGILGIILALLSSPIEAARQKPASPSGVGSRQPPIPQPRPTLAAPAPNQSSSGPAPA